MEKRIDAKRSIPVQRFKVLIVLHQASLTGAPIILYELVRSLIRSKNWDFQFLVMEEGPLLEKCRSTAVTHLWHIRAREKQFKKWGFFGKPLQILYNSWRQRKILSSVQGTDLILSNTIANGAILERLSMLKCPVVSYLHELPYTVRAVTTPETLQKVIQLSNFFLVGSGAVQSYITSNLGVNINNTSILYSSLDVHNFPAALIGECRSRFRLDHMIGERTIIVGVASTAEWRKGFDLWFPLIRLFRLRYHGRKVVFVWKGYRGNADSLYIDLFDFKKTGLVDDIIILPHDGESLKTIAAFDIHLLLSREDPYPLAVLEAACMGIPTVCFEGAGGVPEFIETDAGVCVPYGDLEALAKSLEMLIETPALLRSLGCAARRKVVERHDVEAAAERLGDIIESVYANNVSVVAGRSFFQFNKVSRFDKETI